MKSMTWLSRIAALTAICLLSAAPAAWAQARFTVSLSADSVLMGHYFVATFTLENGQANDFQAPEFRDFDVLSGPNVSTSIQMTNGHVSQKMSYQYYLKPRSEGLYYVEPASVQVGGETVLETAPLAVKVAPNPDGLPQPQPKGMGRDIFGADPFDGDPFGRDFFEGFSWPQWAPRWDAQPPAQPAQPAQPPRRKTTRI
jgi:hypothetical protein